jgi:hypothetical protein
MHMKQSAILIMTSENTARQGVRSTTSSPGWIKLYQVDDCYFDLSYSQEGQQGLLAGQLLREGGAPFRSAKITLISPEGTPLQSAKVSPKKGFRMIVGNLTAHRLELTLDHTTFEVALS